MAQADTARARALYNQYKSILASGPEGAVNNAAVVSDQSGTSVIGTLRARYLTITKREQEIVSRFGQDHPQAVSLRTEEQDVSRQIFQELQQITESYRNQYEAAQSRETSLREGLDNATGKTSVANEALVHLRDLEQNAQALTNLYQTYLGRYQEASQQQSLSDRQGARDLGCIDADGSIEPEEETRPRSLPAARPFCWRWHWRMA